MENNILSTRCCGVTFKNPIVLASGPAGNGEELSKEIDLSLLGGFTSKTITLHETQGNPPPRIVDVYGGIINSIGLQNPGLETFLSETLPFLEQINTPLIISLASNYFEELAIMIKKLNDKQFDFFELNFSCPNVDKAKEPIGSVPEKIYSTLKELRMIANKPLLIKFAPSDNIIDLVKASVNAGADGLVLCNCPKGMKIDINTMKPILKRGFGGFAGPAIKPIALNQVYQVRKEFKDTLIIGTGGVMNHEDALEYLMAGANLVGIGFGVMVDPRLPIDVVKGLNQYALKKDFNYSSVYCKAQNF